MKILFLAAEIAPFVKVGGLADVAGSLPLVLADMGHDIRLAMPYYDAVRARYQPKPVIPLMDVPIGGGTTGAAIFEGELPRTDGGARVPVYFVQNQHFFERPRIYGYEDDGDRFVVFNRAALMMLSPLGWKPDVVHANDWHTALSINYLKTIYLHDTHIGFMKTAFTIHNLAYQGIFPRGWLRQAGLEQYGMVWGDRDGMVNLMGRAIGYASGVSTVSPTYAGEIMTSEYGEGLDWILRDRWGHLWGILNGIDYHAFNPATDKRIFSNYDSKSLDKRLPNKLDLQKRLALPEDPRVPIIGMVTRLADQKGLDLLQASIERMLQKGIQFIILGTGESYYHDFLYWLEQRYRQQVRSILAFDAEMAQRIYAGSDMFLMPSRFEPGGLGQIIAMRYGSIPIVRHTGGLADTVQEYNLSTGTGNGFKFGPYEPAHLLSAVDRALAVYYQPLRWQQLIKTAMDQDFSWETSAGHYLDFYRTELGVS